MAAVPDPVEVLRSTAGKENIQLLSRFYISGGTILPWEMSYAPCPPSRLLVVLSNPANTKNELKTARLTMPQWDCLYPSPRGFGISIDFHFTMVFRKTTCKLILPATGWDALPASADNTLTADLARVKYGRNSVYGHVTQTMEIANDQFLSLSKEISGALVRIAGQISPEKKKEWPKAIDDCYKDPLTAEDERSAQELEMWYGNGMELKKSVKDLYTTILSVFQDVKDKDKFGWMHELMTDRHGHLSADSLTGSYMMEFSQDQLNFCYVECDLVTEGMEQIFKNEWDFLCKTIRIGEWKDTTRNGHDFYNNESRRIQRRHNALAIKSLAPKLAVKIAGSADISTKEIEPDQGADTRWTDTHSDFQKMCGIVADHGMVVVSSIYQQAANIASMEILVEHCAFMELGDTQWFLDVKCRSGEKEWESLVKAFPSAQIEVKSNDILVTLPPLQEEIEIAAFGKPGRRDLKRMQLVTFGRKPVKGRNWIISGYLCDDTLMAVEKLCEKEQKNGNNLLTTCAGLFVANSDENVKIEMTALEPGWQIIGSNIKTIQSRDAWNSPKNATDFPFLSFEICHVEESKQSFFCAITASHGTDITKAEIRAVFEQENVKAEYTKDEAFSEVEALKYKIMQTVELMQKFALTLDDKGCGRLHEGWLKSVLLRESVLLRGVACC